MNTEKLHSIAIAVQDDLKDTQVITQINNIVTALQNQISQPQQPQFQQQLSAHLQQLHAQLKISKANSFSPLWKQILEALGISELLGESLSKRITEIFEHNKITPATALEQTKEIQLRINNKKTAIDQIVTSFSSLGIEHENLQPGECEVGVLIPRLFVDNKLPQFGRELEELQSIFSVFEEIATGSRESLTLKSISSSDFGVFLQTVPPVAACIAVAVERILALYKNYLEIKKLHNGLKEQNLSDASLQGITEHLNKVIGDGIEKAAKEILKERTFKKLDTGRKNELEIELKLSMNKIANRIDRGFNIEIRAEPIEKEEDEANEADPSVNYFAEIASKTEALSFIKTDGEPILSLPESSQKKTKASKKEND